MVNGRVAPQRRKLESSFDPAACSTASGIAAFLPAATRRPSERAPPCLNYGLLKVTPVPDTKPTVGWRVAAGAVLNVEVKVVTVWLSCVWNVAESLRQ